MAGLIGSVSAGSFSVSPFRTTWITSPGYWELEDSLYDFNATECIHIDASDVIIDGKGHTISIDPLNPNPGAGIYIDSGAQRVTLKNFVIDGPFNWSVYADDTQDTWIQDSFFLNSEVGILVDSGSNVVIRNNSITEQSAPNQTCAGIIIQDYDGGSPVIVEENEIEDTEGEGILIRDMDGSSLTPIVIVRGNEISGNTLNGIFITDMSNSLLIDENEIDENGLCGINETETTFPRPDYTNTFSNNYVYENAINGMYFNRSFPAIVTNNTLENNPSHGINVTDTGDCEIDENSISATTIGIGIYLVTPGGSYSDENEVDENSIFGIADLYTNNISVPTGILVNSFTETNVSDTEIVENHIYDETDPSLAIWLRLNVSDTTVESNEVDPVWDGINVWDDYNYIYNNTVEEFSGRGLYLAGSHCIISGNEFYSRVPGSVAIELDDAGYNLEYAVFNLIYNNIFFADTSINWRSLVTTGANTWNVLKSPGPNIIEGPWIGGNYWGRIDNTGWSQILPDRDGDGICDDPAQVGSFFGLFSETDYLPLHATLVFFNGTPTSGNAPLTVNFTGFFYQSIPETWSWDFGDGNTADVQNPANTYENAGIYTVSATITNGTVSNTFTREDYITVNPTAAFDFNVNQTYGPLAVQFEDHSLGNPEGGDWDFGDGMTSDEQFPVHVYEEFGNYLVTLTVWVDVNGTELNDTTTEWVNLTGLPPVAEFAMSPSSGTYPLTVTFIDQSTNNPTGWTWKYKKGAGSWVQFSTEKNPEFTFDYPDTYTISLTATNEFGTSPAKEHTLSVTTPIPIADFIATPRSGYNPLTVQFVEWSWGVTPDSRFLWDFGDGFTSTEDAPLHTYTSSDSYDVTLTVTNGPPGFEETSTIVKPDYIVVSDEPIPVATILPHDWYVLMGDMPLTIEFEGSSTYEPTTWLWNFGDGTSANQQFVTHTFEEPGVYTVTLRVFDTEGRGTQDTVQVVVRPVADFRMRPRTGDAPLNVEFRDHSAYDRDNVEFFWNFEGGFSIDSTEENPEHLYQDSGTFPVTHWVISNGVWSTPITKPMVVGNQPAIDAYPDEGDVPLDVTFEGIAAGSPVDWLWEFGDDDFAHGQNATHTYDDTGIFTVTLTVYYNDRDPVSTTTEIEVYPDADFEFTPMTGNAPLSVQFTDTSEGTIESWFWEASDGWTSTEQNPIHVFTDSGIYYVSLTVETPEGLDSRMTQVLAVFPTADFTWYPAQGQEPLTVQFVDTSVGGGFLSVWEFGDGTQAFELDHPGRGAPVHVYQELGSYTVTLTRYGYDMLPNTTQKVVNLEEAPPMADFTGSPRSGSAPLTVDFTDLSTGEPTSWAWDFGDGATSTMKNPSHTYTGNNDYTVTLTVTNDGGSNTETKVAYIRVSTVPLPVADFTATPRDGLEDLTVQFRDTSMNSPTSWQWEFGDGGTSTLQSPLHTYTIPGHYDVTLTVSNAQGQNSIIKSNYIYVRNTPPVAAFTATPLSGDAPLSVKFTDQSTGNGISSWHWDFGDGGMSIIESPVYVYNAPGVYTVNLTVANDGGSDSEVKTSYISVSEAPPIPPADIVQLYPGWNFVSIPKKLASGEDTAFEVFGDVPLGGHAVLTWDAGAGMWKQITANTVLKPLDGIWIFSVERMDITLEFDTANPPAPVTKQLYTGWNAIGFGGTTSMSARDFLTLSGGLNGNWDVLLGYHNGMMADDPIIRDSSNPRFSDNRPMYPTHGYWIAMSTDDVLQAVV